MSTTQKGVTEDLEQSDRLIYLVENNESKAAVLLLLLSNANYAVRWFTELTDFSTALKDLPAPAAIILSTAFHGDESAGIEAISRLKQAQQTLPPVVFITDEDSMATRLAAVRAGGQYFLTTPVNEQSLFSALDHSLTASNKSKAYKVLLIDDATSQQGDYKEGLKDDRLALRTLAQPLDTLGELNTFNADVILISLNLSDCSAQELNQVIRQHSTAAHTPIIFLYTQADDPLQLETFNAGDNTYLNKNTKPEQLIAAIIAKAKGTHADSSLYQQLQHSLDRSEFYHFAMDQHNIVSITDLGGRITDVNDNFCAISGYSRGELIGQNHRLVKSSYHDKSFYEDMWRTISAGKVWHGEICNLDKGGHEYWVNSTIVPFLDRKGDPWQYISVDTDINALRVSEDRLNRAQNLANIGTWDWNICSDEVHWSERVGPLFGYPPGVRETSFENFQTAIHPDDLPRVMQAIEDCLENGLEYDIEHRIIWPDGSVHWAHESGDVVRNRRGDAIRMLGVVQNITQRKETELGLQEEQRRLKEAQHIGSIGDWWIRFSDNQIHYSDEAAKILDQQATTKALNLDEMLAKLSPSTKKAINDDAKNVIKYGQSNIDFCFYPDKNNRRWVQVARRAIYNKSGKVTGFRGTVQDITERKEAEQQQQHNNRILENIAKDAPLSDTLSLLIEQAEAVQANRFGTVLVTEPTQGHLQCGAAPSLPTSFVAALDALKLDIPLAGHLSRIGSDITSHPNWQNLHEVSLNAGFYICCSRAIQSSSGQLLGLLLMFSPSPHQSRTSCASLNTEIARFAAIALEQKQALWSLIEAKEEADKANQAKSQFLSRISHDLRTPLTAIMGFGQLLGMDKNSPLSQRQKDSVAEINNASEHLLDLIDDILNLAQVESGHIELHLEAVNTSELMAECEALIAPLAAEREISFTTPHHADNEPAGHPFFVEADRKHLKQVVLNLLGNAVKYNRHAGSISISCKPVDENLRILITDTGEGLTKEQQSQVFSAFERLGAEHSGIKGSGIGLVIAKGLVENMAGSIGVESEVGKGSTFWVELPIVLSRPG